MRWPRLLRRRGAPLPPEFLAAPTFHHERQADGSVRPVLDDPHLLHVTYRPPVS